MFGHDEPGRTRPPVAAVSRAALVVALVAGCGGDDGGFASTSDGGSSTGTMGDTTAVMTVTQGDGPTSAADDTATGAADSTGTSSGGTDTTGTDPSTGTAAGCAAIDFLFVIDNSGSMSDEQQNLVASVPSFVAAIESTLGVAADFHVMVVDVDPWNFGICAAACDPPSNCLDAGGQCDLLACPEICVGTFVCGNEPAFSCGLEPEVCEDVLGAGVTHPKGMGASNTDCNFASGTRYIDASEPDFGAAFACAAQVGTSSYAPTELPMEAMVSAVTDGTDAFACNEGFLRDEALLVVTFITDEDDSAEDSAGTPVSWKQALVDAKNGDEGSIVVLGLFGDNDEPDGICADLGAGDDGAEAAPRLRAFVDSFGDHGFFGSVCAPSYEPFFGDMAAPAIVAACADAGA